MRVLGLLAAVVLSAGYYSGVFGSFSAARLGWGLGDWIDPYFINALLEHWYHAVLTAGDPASPPMYAPVRGTLGYSHGLVLFAPFYIAVRPWVDAFQAHTLTLFLVFETGSVCLYLLLRKIGLHVLEAILFSAFFVTSGNVINTATGIWSQTASVFLIPPVLLMLAAAATTREGPMRVALAGIGGLLAALLLTQDHYTGIFTILMAGAFGAAILFGMRLSEGRSPVSRAAAAAVNALTARVEPPGRPSWWWLVVAAAAIAIVVHPVERMSIGGWSFSARGSGRAANVALLAIAWYAAKRWRLRTRLTRLWRVLTPAATHNPALVHEAPGSVLVVQHKRFWLAVALGALVGGSAFVGIYLPVYVEHGAFPAEELSRSLWWPDPARWTSVSGLASDLLRYDSSRSFQLMFLLAAMLWLPWFRADARLRRVAPWLLVPSVLILLIPLAVGAVSFWSLLLGWIPGLSAIRDPKRLIYVYELAATIAVALVLSRTAARSRLRITTCLVVFVLISTQWSRHVFEYKRDPHHFARWVQTPIDIDRSCRSFFVKGASAEYMSRSDNMWTLYAVDAMFIALLHDIPTLNGYSAWAPKEWHLFNPAEPDYRAAVSAWIERFGLKDVCELDIDARTMRPPGSP